MRSCPDFLLLIGKICLKQGICVDLAVQSLNEYLQYLLYNKNFVEAWQLKSVVAGLMIALVISRVVPESRQSEQHRQMVTQVRAEVSRVLKE